MHTPLFFIVASARLLSARLQNKCGDALGNEASLERGSNLQRQDHSVTGGPVANQQLQHACWQLDLGTDWVYPKSHVRCLGLNTTLERGPI